MLRLGIFSSPPVHEAAYGGISLVGRAAAPTGSMPRRAQNERVPIWKQFKLEFVEENKISDLCFVRCGKIFVVKLS
jgi:hypothetical protein